MSDYILNRISTLPAYASLGSAQADMALLLSALAACDEGAVELPAFRSHSDLWTTPLAKQGEQPLSFGEVAHSLYGTQHHDAATYFDSLSRMSPADLDLSELDTEYFLTIEPEAPAAGLEAAFSAVLRNPHDTVLCAITGSTLASLPRDDDWKHGQLGFTTAGTEHKIDHVSLPEHASAIIARRIEEAKSEITARSFWTLKDKAFPHLRFGLDVERQIKRFSAHIFPLAVQRLANLNRRALAWKSSADGAFPDGSPDITPETSDTMKNYGHYRNYKGDDGKNRCFEDHQWIDSSHRLHLIKHEDDRTVEIGYIGRHLPTMKFPT